MNKLLITLFVFFVAIDIVLAFVVMNPSFRMSVASMLSEGCRVVEKKQCKTVTFKNNTIALFKLKKGTKVYAPVSGEVQFVPQAIIPNDPIKYPIHYLKASNGDIFYIVFEPEQPMNSVKKVAKGESIGTVAGKTYSYMNGGSLAVSVINNHRFAKATFDSLFRP